LHQGGRCRIIATMGTSPLQEFASENLRSKIETRKSKIEKRKSKREKRKPKTENPKSEIQNPKSQELATAHLI
jgi:hypothetical protein